MNLVVKHIDFHSFHTYLRSGSSLIIGLNRMTGIRSNFDNNIRKRQRKLYTKCHVGNPKIIFKDKKRIFSEEYTVWEQIKNFHTTSTILFRLLIQSHQIYSWENLYLISNIINIQSVCYINIFNKILSFEDLMTIERQNNTFNSWVYLLLWNDRSDLLFI